MTLTGTRAEHAETPMTNHEVNILLVDDRAERLLSYEVALECLGYNLVRAQSGNQALWRLMETEFAAILLDVSMPGMDGFETAALIRNHPRFEETPIIFVTGVQVSDLDQRKGYEMGAVDYVQIPVIPEILRGKVQALVQLYLQRAELSRLNQELAAANSELEKAHDELKAQNMRDLRQLNQTLEQANSKLVASNTQLTQEIAERKRVEKALYDSARKKDEYIAILAHELRNPLSAMHNAVQVMQLEDASPQQIVWAQDLLERQVKHLTCLMDDLLDVSRISNGRIHLRRETVNLGKVVAHAADTITPLLEKHGHRLDVSLPDTPLYVNGDMVRLTQILGNLLTNAIKYMDDGGIIWLSLIQDDQHWATIRVRDQGVGIDPEHLHTVFNLFVQAPTAMNRAQGGLGIGLALVQALVGLHGGVAEVASKGHGEGAEFSVRLPLVAVSEQPSSAVLPSSPVELTVLNVLVVDDNVDSARGLAMCLESQGYKVRSSHTGNGGYSAAEDYQPDVVLLDIGLPDIDGYEVAQRLRQDENLSDVTIIAMTGYGGELEKSKAKEAGFNHYLVKPVDLSRLLALLNDVSARTPHRSPVPAQYNLIEE